MENRKELMRTLEDRDDGRYITLPEEWTKDMEDMCLLKVASCKHFKREGIKEGGYIGIDTTKPFEEGKPCAFVKMTKQAPIFKLSRKFLSGFECIGQLALVVNFPMTEVPCGV